MAKFSYSVVFVSNMKRSIAFYRDIIGLPLRFESEEWTEFDTPGTTLALHHSETPATPESGDVNRVGQCHLSFTVDDIDAFHKHLVAKGVACVRPPQEEAYGRKLAKYADLDGLPFTVSQPMGGGPQ
ncbi:MAG TPA: VOC family protein [Pirellulales bacterium]|nr:VOC family protein [Pirellulales bacterium]